VQKAILLYSFLSVGTWMLVSPILVCAAEGANSNSVPKLTIEALLNNKEQWKGKRVEVSGFYVMLFEVSALYRNEQDANSVKIKDSLWIDYYDEVPTRKGELKWVKTGFIRIVGTFDFQAKLGSGHLNQWPARLRKIELVEPILKP